MNFQDFGVIIALTGGILSILGNAIAITWSFAKLSAKLDNWIVSFSRFEENYKEHKIRMDDHIKALWEKQDILKDKIISIESKGEA